jgi:predicted ribosomally synthesized peptide with SipW-like signal peptide
MKKIILSLGMLTFAAAAVVGGTGAFFSDQITSEENVFTAGEVSLTGDSIVHTYNGVETDAPIFTEDGFSFALADIKPLDEGSIDYNLTNGTNDAYVCVMVDETGNNDNGVNNPEGNAGDLSDGPGSGELGAFLNVAIGGTSGSLASLSGTWFDLGQIAAGAPISSGIDYCFGEFDGSSCVLDEDALYNLAQTDSLTADVSFYAVQARNNDFSCDDLNQEREITNDDLFTVNDRVGAFLSQDWFFYNDSNDTIMSLNEFGGAGGTNEITAAPEGRAGAHMVLHEAGARYNIATYRFASTPLVGVTDLKFTVYDTTDNNRPPFFNINVSFDGVDNWQRRLVYVPGASTNPAVPVNTWTEVDAIQGGAGMWTWSGYFGNGSQWPDGNTDQYRSWSDLETAFPNMQIRDTDSFFGVRVGHPGPDAEESYVDSISFNGVLYDFEN